MNLLLPGVSLGVAGIVAALFVAIKLARLSKLDAIPTVGSTCWIGSWWAGLKYFTNALDVIQEGYDKHKSAPFKVATLRSWIVAVGGREHVEELRRAPDDVLSFSESANDMLQVEYTMEPEVHHNPYHAAVIRSQLTRNIGSLFSDIRDEIVTTFDEVLDLKGSEWKSVVVLSSIQQVVCRTSNRVFVGLPLCRDPDWIDLNIRYAIDVITGGFIIGLFPTSLKPIAARFFTGLHRSKERARRLLGPIIEERRKYLNEYGPEWTDKLNDLLSWLMEESDGPELSTKSLTARILTVNFASIHATSRSITMALLYLAANPDYVQPLREEVEGIVQKEGWSKAALSKMRKVDSFLRECSRVQEGTFTTVRKALKDFTFSDGTFIPKGTLIGVATGSIHHDERFYDNADVFVPFRFAELQEEGGEAASFQLASISFEYQVFGQGKHACPGRFLAANEMKTMLAHVVTTYDVKLEDGTTLPPSLRFATSTSPDPGARVLFRRR